MYLLVISIYIIGVRHLEMTISKKITVDSLVGVQKLPMTERGVDTRAITRESRESRLQ